MQNNRREPQLGAVPEESLIDALPDLVVQLSRDGTVLRHAGGRSVRGLRAAGSAWPPTVAALIKQLTRRAIASREPCEASFDHAGGRYEARVSAQSPDRAIGLIRSLSSGADAAPEADAGEEISPRVDRREFWRRVTDTVSSASLSGRPIALAVIHVEGLADILAIMDANVCDRVIGIGIQRLSQLGADPARPWYVGPLADDELALVVQSDDRDAIEACVRGVCDSVSEPIRFGDATFHLKAYAGIAILGQDANSQKSLLQNARSATTEARRAESAPLSFFSDTMKLRSLTRLDVAEELRDAIANRHIRLKYRGRHDLESGRLVALVGYLQWMHPVRGEIRPAQFLAAAAATGLATALSRSLLDHLREDFAAMLPNVAPQVRISYGALRHHVLDGEFVPDIRSVLGEDSILPERLELRISERTYLTRDIAEWQSLADRGVQFVVDEVGRKMSSIERLARAPLSALQLDRACAGAVAQDPTAAKVGRAVASVARALGLIPIATAVDSAVQRRTLLELGYTQGIGDVFVCPEAAALQADRPMSEG